MHHNNVSAGFGIYCFGFNTKWYPEESCNSFSIDGFYVTCKNFKVKVSIQTMATVQH